MQRPVFLLGLLGFLPQLWAFAQIGDERVRYSIVASALVSAFGFLATKRLIPVVRARTLKAGLHGLDINKRGTELGEKRVPEALGLAVGVVFLVCIVLFQQLHYHDVASLAHHVFNGRGAASAWRPEYAADAWLVDYNAALATICFMLFLGFADDVLDVPWRVKLQLPAVAALPLLIAYSGGTVVKVPLPLRELAAALLPSNGGGGGTPGGGGGLLPLPEFLDLGPLYYLYMVALTIFCTNSINILAGINGLEAGQTFVIACAVLLLNLTELAGYAAQVPAVRDGHLFSAYLMMPLAATTLALLLFNWYPSQVFVGDTFTYFAGMAFAVAGILGHFSETLLLFFVPQIFNFVYSVPQLFKFVHCPRHRLPTYDPATGLLTATPNWNLVNLTLSVLGPCSEPSLCVRILAMQVLSCAGAFAVRHAVRGWYKE